MGADVACMYFAQQIIVIASDMRALLVNNCKAQKCMNGHLFLSVYRACEQTVILSYINLSLLLSKQYGIRTAKDDALAALNDSGLRGWKQFGRPLICHC